jgi:hypothetical protein
VLTEVAALTESTDGSLEIQLTVRPDRAVPLPSFGVAVSTCCAPTTIGVVGAESVTVVTGASVTAIEDVPILASLVAVIVTGPPAATAVTKPVVLTVATAPLLEDHVTARSVSTAPFASLVTAVSCCAGVIPNTKLADEGLTVTVATGTGLTMITGVVAPGADSLTAVIVAVPAPTAVTVIVAPLDVLTELAVLTERTAGSLETQLTGRPDRVVPFPSLGVAVSTCAAPTTIGVAGMESVTVATGASVTVIDDVPVLVSLVAVIVTGPPAATAVTKPVVLTVATALLLEDHVTVRPVSTAPFASLVTAVSC